MKERGQSATSVRRAVRADTERTVQSILEAAERLLRRNPAATIEQIAEAAGVARTTVHRRFATRELLIDTMIAWATRQFGAAVASGYSESAPPLVALYQVTASVLRVKIGWEYAMSRTLPTDPELAHVHRDVRERCAALFRRAQEQGAIRPDADLEWTRNVYYALVAEAAEQADDGRGVDELATLVVDTLLSGVGTGRTIT